MNKNTIVFESNQGNKKDLNNAISRKIAQDEIEAKKVAFFKDGGVIQEVASFGVQATNIDPVKKTRKPQHERTLVINQVRRCLSVSKIAYLYIKNNAFNCRKDEQEESDSLKFIQSFTHIEQIKRFKLPELN